MRFNTKFTVITGTQDFLIVKCFLLSVHFVICLFEKYIYFTKLGQWLHHQEPITSSTYICAAITDMHLHCFSPFVLLMSNIVYLLSTNLISATLVAASLTKKNPTVGNHNSWKDRQWATNFSLLRQKRNTKIKNFVDLGILSLKHHRHWNKHHKHWSAAKKTHWY